MSDFGERRHIGAPDGKERINRIIEMTRTTVVKSYWNWEVHDEPLSYEINAFYKEVAAYQALPERFRPEFAEISEDKLAFVMERVTTLREVADPHSLILRDGLIDYLSELHEAGWSHRDLSVDNVGIKNGRVIMFDFEWTIQSNPLNPSYDLYGAIAAKMIPPWGDKAGNGVWWACDSPLSPAAWWGEPIGKAPIVKDW